jgi:hypothetical protein
MRSMLLLALLVPCVSLAQLGNRSRAAGADLEAAQAAAESNAARPGDENLSCEQLQAEVTRIATSGQVTGALGGQQGFAQQAARAQQAQAEAEAIQNAGSRSERERLQREQIENTAGQDVAANESDGRRGGGLGRRLGGALGGFGGGGGFGGRGRGAAAPDAGAGNDSPDASADAEDAALASQIESIGGITPEVMRADHLMTLAENRKCAWVKDYR